MQQAGLTPPAPEEMLRAVMRLLLLVASGGAVGSAARFLVGGWVQRQAGAFFPAGTLVVNVLGCACIGLLAGLAERRLGLGPDGRAFLLLGVLGGFTTFSSFSYETVALVASGAAPYAWLNVILTVVLCLLATWGALVLGRL